MLIQVFLAWGAYAQKVCKEIKIDTVSRHSSIDILVLMKDVDLEKALALAIRPPLAVVRPQRIHRKWTLQESQRLASHYLRRRQRDQLDCPLPRRMNIRNQTTKDLPVSSYLTLLSFLLFHVNYHFATTVTFKDLFLSPSTFFNLSPSFRTPLRLRLRWRSRMWAMMLEMHEIWVHEIEGVLWVVHHAHRWAEGHVHVHAHEHGIGRM